MTCPFIPKVLREKIAVEAGYRCGYCLTPQEFTAMPMHVEHIIPYAAGGPSTEDNLWLACPLCNAHKGVRIYGIDPENDARVSLFNPRRQVWHEHFDWSEDGVFIVGQSACGRATVAALQLNNEHVVKARRRWVMVGWHPPKW